MTLSPYTLCLAVLSAATLAAGASLTIQPGSIGGQCSSAPTTFANFQATAVAPGVSGIYLLPKSEYDKLAAAANSPSQTSVFFNYYRDFSCTGNNLTSCSKNTGKTKLSNEINCVALVNENTRSVDATLDVDFGLGGGGLSTGALIGIVIGALIVAAIVGAIVMRCIRNRRKPAAPISSVSGPVPAPASAMATNVPPTADANMYPVPPPPVPQDPPMQFGGQYPPPSGQYPPPSGQYPPPGQYPGSDVGAYPPPPASEVSGYGRPLSDVGAYPPPAGQYPPPSDGSYLPPGAQVTPVVFYDGGAPQGYPPPAGQYPPPGNYPPAQGYPPPQNYPPPQGH